MDVNEFILPNLFIEFPQYISPLRWQESLMNLARFVHKFSARLKSISPLPFRGNSQTIWLDSWQIFCPTAWQLPMHGLLHFVDKSATNRHTIMRPVPCLRFDAPYNCQPAEEPTIIWFPEIQSHACGHMCFPDKSATNHHKNATPLLLSSVMKPLTTSNIPLSVTVDNKGAKSVIVRSTGNEKITHYCDTRSNSW